jgi:hypothetical protein
MGTPSAVEVEFSPSRIIFISIFVIPYPYDAEVFIFLLWIYTQSVRLLGLVIGPSQGLYLNT